MYLSNLIMLIVEWSYARNIICGSTPAKQHEKAQEELDELGDAIRSDDLDEVRDAIGDTIVCLTNIAEQYGLSVGECVEAAYDEIKDRKGEMIDGKFVKEADLATLSRH